ncbi:MAG: tRNA (N(6)-L-threonylcarbamoyladenosine(37)-C(2))-methylthiotransferase MtaB [Alphaproteobacteria bacterium]
MKYDVKIITLGCRINSYESEIMREKLLGLDIPKPLIVINSCAVTGEAERQCRQMIRKIRKENEDAIIIVTGCAAQVSPFSFAKMKEVNYVLGNVEKLNIDDFMRSQTKEKVAVKDIFEKHDHEPYIISDFEGRTRAFVQVQQGCDHRCTYCIVPYARGENFSIPEHIVLTQINELIASGFNEIVISGVDVASYGIDRCGKSELSLLIKNILEKTPQLKRLRISSIDPKGFDDLLIDLAKNDPRLLPHFHLSIQSGDDLILKRMGRRHLSKDIITLAEKLRAVRSDIVLGSDFITGFPTETEAMFNNTVSLVKECNITHLHVFPFSPREGTPAAKMPQVEREVSKQRAKILRDVGEELMLKLYASKLGHKCSVLTEKHNSGFCEHYLPVKLNQTKKEGTICSVEINQYDSDGLYGVCL